jgi:hypothetical protein
MTLNMIFGVLLHQYVPQEEEASEILQRCSSETNDYIMNCLQPHLPIPPKNEDAFSHEDEPFIPTMTMNQEDIMAINNEEEDAEMYMWDDDLEDDQAMQDALPTDARGDIIIPKEKNTLAPSPKGINVSGLGIRIRPDVHTHNVFMKAWATQCSNLRLAEHHMRQIYEEMQQEGNELAPTQETYSLMLQFYSTHSDRFAQRLDNLIRYQADKEGIRNVPLVHWYYGILGLTKARTHKLKAKEYWENMMYSSNHHPWQNRTVHPDKRNVVFSKKDGHDIETITLLQKGAQHLMGMYRNLVVHWLNVARNTSQMGPEQGPKTLETANSEMESWMRCSLDTYTKLKAHVCWNMWTMTSTYL